MKKQSEYQYLDLLNDILKNGVKKEVYGAKTYIKSVFGRQIRFDLSKGFPLLTTKKVYLRAIIYELLWFLRGESNIKYLVDNNVHIWDEWAYKEYKSQNSKLPSSLKLRGTSKSQILLNQEEFIEKIKQDAGFEKNWGDLGNVYGVQWRKWKTSDGRSIDQLGWAIEKLKKSPYRKHILVSAWNPEFIYEMASLGKSMVLPPCHTMFQFNTYGKKLSLQLYQRSADLFLGVPFNIASYSLLLIMVAQVSALVPHEFILTFGDVHIYSNHFDQVGEQLKRKPKTFPKMILNPKVKKIDDFKFEDFTLINYNPHPPIKGEVTVVGGF